MILRVPPQNLDAERAVIGSVLIDNNCLLKVVDLVRPEYFYDLRHGILFETIVTLFSQNKPVDVVTLGSELKRKGKVTQSGGTSYLSEIISSVPTSANVEEYCKIVKENSVRRNLISFGAKLDENARDEVKTLEQILDEVENNLLSLSTDNSAKQYYDAPTLLEMQMKRADEFAKNPGGFRGIPCGLKSMDKMLGGFQKSDLVILAARPSVGKSALGFDMLRHMAVNEKKSVAIFSLEMPAVQVIERVLAQQIDVNLWNLRMGKLSDEDYRKYSEGAGKLSESKIFVDDTAGLNIMQLKSKARKLVMDHGLDIILIDYLQLMQGTARIENRAQEVGEISRSLKILARELNIPVIALSQLNRAVENRIDRVPQLSDLRESGSIEQDADLVIFLGRDLNQDTEQQEVQDVMKVDVFIAKHRNGPTGRFSLNFHANKTKFKDVEE